jgi:hypothetical protein
MNFGNRGGQTIRLTIQKPDGTELKILTGTSYKDWIDQAVEYIFRNFGHKTHGWRYEDVRGLVLEVEHSRSSWIGWGGLKWCREDMMQAQLNREGVQSNEPDNPKPRQYSKFKFDYYPLGYDRLIKALKEY